MNTLEGVVPTRRQALARLTAAGVGLAAASTIEMDLFAQGPLPSRLPEWPAPKINGFKKIGGVKIYYEEQGMGIPVFLCPGGHQPALITRPCAAKLASKYRVISLDRP